jgi:hypothetical protein
MTFKGKHLVPSKIVIDGSKLEQVKQYSNYLGCELSLDGELDFDKKKRFQSVCSTIRKHLKETRIDIQMKVHKVVA